jgi:hypothetical protein
MRYQRTAEQLSQLGLGRGDRIAIVLPNGAEMAAAFVSAVHQSTEPAMSKCSAIRRQYCRRFGFAGRDRFYDCPHPHFLLSCAIADERTSRPPSQMSPVPT